MNNIEGLRSVGEHLILSNVKTNPDITHSKVTLIKSDLAKNNT